jgi:peptide/nickel transport system permease protein
VIAFFFVLVNLVVDLLYVAIDPRLRIRDVHDGLPEKI